MTKKILPVAALFFAFTIVPTATAASYKKTLDRWTRSDSVFAPRDLKAEILWSATYLSEEMIWAQAQLYQKTYRLPVSDREKFASGLQGKRGDEALFFVSFYSHDRRFDDLTNPLAKWDLRLECGGETERPSRIEKIVRLSPLESVFFPDTTPWSKAYYVWFPGEILSRPSPWKLSVFGPRAHSTLVWR